MTIDLSKWIRAVVNLDREADALWFEEQWRSWGWFAEGIGSFDEVVGDLGAGIRVGVLMRNRPEIARTVAATLAGNRCLVTLSSAIPMTKLAAEITMMRLPVVVAGTDDWADEQFTSAVSSAGSLGVCAEEGSPAFRIILPADDRGPDIAGTAMGVAVEMLTSGTTGPPKRIDLPYRGLENELESTAQYGSSGLGELRLSSGTSLLWYPLLHISGLRAFISSLVAGRKVALLERFSVEAWADMVREHRPRVVSLVPAVLTMVLDADLPRELFGGISAVFSGTAPLDPDVARQFEERYGVPVLAVYGATEFAGGVAGWTLRDWQRFGHEKTGSVGRANVGVEVRVVDPESGAEMPRGGVGLLEVRAPQLSRPGWLRTTDLARMDDADFIWIVGRADDVIVRGGFKVATNTVRDVLASHPDVHDACVTGISDRRLGQVPVAAVELRPAAGPVDPDELMNLVREQLAPYQVPVELRIVEELPRTPSMKVSQAAVRQLFEPSATQIGRPAER